MHSVRQSGKLQKRVERSDDPDFDKIITSYNEMLGEIETRTNELSVAMDQLAIARDQGGRSQCREIRFSCQYEP